MSKAAGIGMENEFSSVNGLTAKALLPAPIAVKVSATRPPVPETLVGACRPPSMYCNVPGVELSGGSKNTGEGGSCWSRSPKLADWYCSTAGLYEKERTKPWRSSTLLTASLTETVSPTTAVGTLITLRVVPTVALPAEGLDGRNATRSARQSRMNTANPMMA